MESTRANITGGIGEALPAAVVEDAGSGKGKTRASSCSLGTTPGKGHGHGVEPVRGRVREVSPVSQIDAREDQVSPNPEITPCFRIHC